MIDFRAQRIRERSRKCSSESEIAPQIAKHETELTPPWQDGLMETVGPLLADQSDHAIERRPRNALR